MIFQALYNMLTARAQEKDRWIGILKRIGLTGTEAESLFALCEKHRQYSASNVNSFNRIIQWAYSGTIEPYELRAIKDDYPGLSVNDDLIFNDFLISTGVRHE